MKLKFGLSDMMNASDPYLTRLPEEAFYSIHSRPAALAADFEEGSTTVEYAIGAIATAAFAGLLLAVLKSGGVRGMLTSIIQTALSV